MKVVVRPEMSNVITQHELDLLVEGRDAARKQPHALGLSALNEQQEKALRDVVVKMRAAGVPIPAKIRPALKRLGL